LEDLLALIDAPELNKLSITFTDTPELARFVSRMPKLGMPYEARMVLHDFRIAIMVKLPPQIFGQELLDVGISSGDIPYIPEELAIPDSQRLSCLTCASLFPTVSTVENLYIYEAPSSEIYWDEYTESTGWLELLRSFIALKSLYLDKEFAPHVALALEDLDEDSITELLPNLQNISCRGFGDQEISRT
jgi:hypothetical protein